MEVHLTGKFVWWKRILPSLAFLLFVIYLANESDSTSASWVVGALGLPALAIAVRYLREDMRPGPRLEMTEDGLCDTALGVGFIPWSDITLLSGWSMKNSGEGVRMFMDRDVTQRYLQKLSRWRRIVRRLDSFFTATRGLVINTHGYDRSRDEILEFMRQNHDRATAPADRVIETDVPTDRVIE